MYYERDELGREVEKRLPNGVTTYHNYDVAGQVESILHVGPAGVLQSLYYTYDVDGQRTKIEREDGTRVYFGYDAAHRLTGEDWLDPSDTHIYGFAYQYDAAGNRLQKTFNGEVTYYDYNNLNQLTTERVLGGGATYYAWTADGEMATKQEAAGWTYYTWDVDESLKKIEAPNVTLENRYNSRMQRVWRSEDGEAEWLVYDAQKLVAEATTGGLERYYLSEGGSVYSPLVSQLGSQHWFQFDALGTTLGLTDDSGGLSDTFLYEAFGTSLERTGMTQTCFLGTGAYGWYHDSVDGNVLLLGLVYQPNSAIGLSSLTEAGLARGIVGTPRPPHRRISWSPWLSQDPIIGPPHYVTAPINCYAVATSIAQPISDRALSRFPGNPNEADNRRDAFRHCVWMCAITALVGEECAWAVGVGHEGQGIAGRTWRRLSKREKVPIWDPGSSMDMHNNAISRAIGKGICSRDPIPKCETACLQALKDNSLHWLKPAPNFGGRGRL